MRLAGGGHQIRNGEVVEAVGADGTADVLHRPLMRDQLVGVGDIDAEEAGPADWRGGDADVDLARAASLTQEIHKLVLRRAAHDAVVDHDHAFTACDCRERVVLEAHPELPQLGGWLDERASDIAISQKAVGIGQPAGLGVTGCRGDGRVRDAHHEVRVHRVLQGKSSPHLTAHGVDQFPLEGRVRPGEVDVLEGTKGVAVGRHCVA